MSKKIFALLVGINDYAPSIGKLSGCLNDVQHFHDFLTDNFDREQLSIETLKDSDATRANIISQFRSHLCRAKADDVVVFQYCGHGARCASAQEFHKFYPDRKDEGLVCYDSRSNGVFDLADKEIAVLLAEISQNDPHLAVILDCCHSGSATRGADDFTQLKARQTHEVYDERPLDSYLGGFYAGLLKRGDALEIPACRHILLAACERTQKAWEGKNRGGVFTNTLIDALHNSGSEINYADLFVRCRAVVRKYADNQDPQFDTYRSFNAYSGFLGNIASHAARRFSVYFGDDGWNVDCGAIHGLPTDPEKQVELVLYPETDRGGMAGHAVTTLVGAQKSEIAITDFDGDTDSRYQAEITSLPAAPLAVYLMGDEQRVKDLQQFYDESEDHSICVSFITEGAEGARYVFSAEDDRYLLRLRETGKLIQGASGFTKTSAEYMFSVLKIVSNWERAQELQNHSTRLNTDQVEFQLVENLADGQRHTYKDAQVTLDICEHNGEWSAVSCSLNADNRTEQLLHMVLIHSSQDYGIQVLYNEPVEPTESSFVVTLDGYAEFDLGLEDEEGDESVHNFKLIVSTEKIDDFLLGQAPLKLGEIVTPRTTRGLRFGSNRKKLVHKNEWFTKDLQVKLVRRVDELSTADSKLADGKITIKGHPALTAGVSLAAAKSGTRSAGGGSDIYRALERHGEIELLNFAGTRGNDASILEITDIQNAESLRENPLEIELDLGLQEHEFVLPLVFDGEYLLLTGESSKDESGVTHVSISEIPKIPDNRRSLGRALRLYFFKTILKRENVNQLCWVEYEADNSAKRHCSLVADKVADAKNVIVLMHGIIGDTQGIAEGLRLATCEDGATVDQKFDLVLTYDYENLNTPISKIADHLKQQLQDAGLDENDDKHLTMLVHSMGGLVARSFIEQGGGSKTVDHLIMFGTPNNGSPFGKIGYARTLSAVLTTIAMNSVPFLVPFGTALLSMLGRSKNVTLTLEQMNPDSDFIKELNASPDPGVRYTIVAGDVREYEEESDEFMAGLIAKLGSGMLFDTLYQGSGHDIAVSLESIRGVTDERDPAPKKVGAVCHHLNYFDSDAGLKALSAIDWQ